MNNAIEVQGSQLQNITHNIAKYMREVGLRSKLSRKYKATTDSKHNYLMMENVLNKNFLTTSKSEVWISDTTYIQTREGFCT